MTKGTMRSSERGAILIHVAVGLLVLIGFTTFVVDYGILWVGRGHAQNAADASALAAAVALAFDDPNDRTDAGPAKQSAWQTSQANFIWGASPAVDISTDITFPICPDGTDACVRVDVYRNQARGNPLPIVFGGLLGLSAQGIRATATAQARGANSSECLKPWGIPDKWLEVYPTPGPWTETSDFEKYADNQGGLLDPRDQYVQPTDTDSGTGFTLAGDYGRRMALKQGSPGQAIAPSFFYALQLGDPGGATYSYNIAKCVGIRLGIGDRVPIEPGNKMGPTLRGVKALIAQDPNAYWDPGSQTVANSLYGQSPRIVLLPVFHTEYYEDGRQTGRLDVEIVNIIGFFLEQVTAQSVEGYFMMVAGDYSGGNSTVTENSSFAKTIRLVQ